MSEKSNDNGDVMKISVERTSEIAMKNWEFMNGIQPVEKIYQYNAHEQAAIRNVKPWDKDPYYFKEVKISALALLKMVMHARSGKNLEIMGLLLGKVAANAFIIMDSVALPVEGTETQVNAQSQAYEHIVKYQNCCESIGRLEKVVGWYHSHPGYGCWLSGIDVATQLLHQTYQEPFVAVVIDPLRTMSSGKVDLGAFRTYPKGYKAADALPSDFQSIPSHKIEDFGVHCKQYYALDVLYFKSALDARLLSSMWNTYWVNTSSRTPSLVNDTHFLTSQMKDLKDKLCVANFDAREYLESKRDRKTTIVGKKISRGLLQGLLVQQYKAALFSKSL